MSLDLPTEKRAPVQGTRSFLPSGGDSYSASRVDAERGELLGGRDALAGPAAGGVVLVEHRLQVDDHSLARAALVRDLPEALGQRVVGAGEAGAQVPEALQVPDPLAGAEQLLVGPVEPGGGAEHRPDVLQRE